MCLWRDAMVTRDCRFSVVLMHTYKMLLALVIDRVEKKRCMASLSQELPKGWDPKSWLLNVLDHSYLFCCTVRRQTVHVNAVRLCQSWQEVLLAGQVVHWQCSLAGGQVLVVVDGEFCREFPFDGGGPLELVVDLHAQAPSSLLELGGDVGCPLCSVGSELPNLQQKSGIKRRIMAPRISDIVYPQEREESAGLPKSCRCHRHKFLMPDSLFYWQQLKKKCCTSKS